MNIETEDQCIQDIGHTFMTPHWISDKVFSEEFNKNPPRLAAMQFPISRNLLIHVTVKLIMESELDWKPFSRERMNEIQQFHDSLVNNQLTKNNFHMLGNKHMNMWMIAATYSVFHTSHITSST